ncbi:MAG: hypothetical protein PHW32_01865 [Bacilli bacterium]|nr:hypothetical protein [Bacilli bacterium]MDD4282919.1 hypothetical protein [Bacilli bacterium]MDD4718360.1 hypothetical protein [Bacilli bacterium]
MEILESYRLTKKKAEVFIKNRHLYIANILKELFTPGQHRYLCEIGAGDFELANILANLYENIDAYEMHLQPGIKSKISNLKIYSSFSRFVNVSNYNLLISVCPYYYSYDIDDYIDDEEETQNLVTDILDLSVENNINSFIVLSNTDSTNEVIKEVRSKNKYNNIAHDDINLYYEKDGRMKTSNNKVLIYRK